MFCVCSSASRWVFRKLPNRLLDKSYSVILIMLRRVKLTWHSNGPLRTCKRFTGQRGDAHTCHVGSPYLELVLHVLLQIWHLGRQGTHSPQQSHFRNINRHEWLEARERTSSHINPMPSSPCRLCQWQTWCWPRATSPPLPRRPRGNPQSTRWCLPHRWTSAASRTAPLRHARTPERWCHRAGQGSLWQRRRPVNIRLSQVWG